jgi:hypothetical protein
LSPCTTGAFTVEAGDLVGMIKRTLFATAKENTRYALNGVLWEVEGNNLTLVATDGRRLSLVRGKCKDGPEAKKTAIVPSKAMLLIERCLTDAGEAKGPVRVVISEKDILLESSSADGGKRIVYSRLVDGHFPKYDDVIPKDLEKKAVLAIPLSALVLREKPQDKTKPAEKASEEEGVYAVGKDGRVKFTPVQKGITGDLNIEIVSGLAEGQDIVVGPYNALRTLKDGTLVKPEEPKKEAAK